MQFIGHLPFAAGPIHTVIRAASRRARRAWQHPSPFVATFRQDCCRGRPPDGPAICAAPPLRAPCCPRFSSISPNPPPPCQPPSTATPLPKGRRSRVRPPRCPSMLPFLFALGMPCRFVAGGHARPSGGGPSCAPPAPSVRTGLAPFCLLASLQFFSPPTGRFLAPWCLAAIASPAAAGPQQPCPPARLAPCTTPLTLAAYPV